MPRLFNKTLMVILLCLIFIGQSMASMTMFYGMASMSTMNEKSSMTMAHHQMSESDDHNMASNTDCQQEAAEPMNCAASNADDCCAQECDCLTSGCSTISAFFASTNYSADIAVSSKITSSNFVVSSQALTSLYRPPILS